VSLVSIVRIKQGNFEEAITESLRLIQYSFRNDIHDVVIKPNLCYYLDYSTGYTTDPHFVASLANVLRKQISSDLKIHIVESDASAMKCKHAFRLLGYEKMAQDSNLTLSNLSEDKSCVVDTNVNGHSYSFRMPSTIQNADLLINVPKIKYTISSVKISGAMKNIFGCNPYPHKYKYHSRLNEVIVALNKVMKFNLCILDGNVVLGDGTRKLGLVMTSEDNVAIDAACAKIVGYSPRRVKFLSTAAKEKIGQTSFQTVGVPLDYFCKRFPRRSLSTLVKSQAFYYATKLGLDKKLGIG